MEIKRTEEQPIVSKESIDAEIQYNETTERENLSFSFSNLLKDGARQGVKAVKWFFIVMSVFGIINIVFLILSIINQSSRGNLYTTLTLLTGILIIGFALYLTYRYILVDALNVAYKYLTPLFKRVCVKVIDIVVAGGNKLSGRDINKSLNVGSLMVEIYGKKAPKYVQKGLLFVLSKIPFNNFLVNMQKELSERKDNRTLSEILYKQLDDYIINSIFKENTMKWMLWLSLANITVQIAIIYFIK